MKNKRLITLTTILTLLLVPWWEHSLVQAAETSSAGISFLPNPELPLPPAPGPSEDPIGTGAGHLTGSLPQTGEKELSPLIGLIVTLAVLIIWYFRRKLLKNKIQTHIGGN